MSPVFGKSRETEAVESPQRPRLDGTCTCGSAEFAPGGPVVHAWQDGETCGVEPSGSVLSCLACGTRWYTTPRGLRNPHRDAMPPAWAMADMQREQVERREAERAESLRQRDAAPRREPASRRFSAPPRPV